MLGDKLADLNRYIEKLSSVEESVGGKIRNMVSPYFNHDITESISKLVLLWVNGRWGVVDTGA